MEPPSQQRPAADDLLGQLDEVVFRTDPEGRWTYLNPAWERLTGFPVAETLGTSFLDLVHPDEREDTVAKFMAVVLGGGNYCRHDTRYLHAGGGHRWVEVRATVLREDGEVVGNVGTLHDVTARKRAEALLDDQTRLLEMVSRDRPLGEILGAVAAMVATQLGQPASVVHFPHGDDDVVGAEGDDGGLFVTAMADGTVVPGMRPATTGAPAAVPIRIDGGATVGVLVVHRDEHVQGDERDVTTRGAELAALAIGRTHRQAGVRRRALYDPLTALPNRYLFEDRLTQAIAEARRRRSQVAVLLLDLDGFKDINDTLGHEVGDRVLRAVGRRLTGALRSVDTVGRLGGDEFVVVLPDLAGVADAEGVAAKLQQALRAPFEVEGVGLDVSVSTGIALYPTHGDDLDSLLRAADAAMYRVKGSRGGTAVFESGTDRGRASSVSQAAELRQAIDADQLVLEYQPTIDLRDGCTVGVEALVRWRHPSRGLLPPDAFIPLAQHTGLMKPLTRWVLETALAETAGWRADRTGLALAVNVSAGSLRDPDLVRFAVDAADRWSVGPRQLELEVTESAVLTDPDAAIRAMNELDAAGISFTIDDFGTGYSSLSHLTRLPARTIKIDRSFLRDLLANRRDSSIVQAVVHIGHDLDVTVVAEGVEDGATFRRIAQLGCDQAQGYHVARPMPAHQLDTWLTATAEGVPVPPPS